MDKSSDGVGKFVHRRMSQLKILSRLLEHELDAAKGAKDISLERGLLEDTLDTLEIFIEDVEGASGGGMRSRQPTEKTVSRLN
jgi:hypothetical protein